MDAAWRGKAASRARRTVRRYMPWDWTQLASPASRRTTPGAEVVDALQGRQAKPTLCPGDSRRLDSGGQLGQSAEP